MALTPKLAIKTTFFVLTVALLNGCGLRGPLVLPPGPGPEPVLGWPGGIRPGTKPSADPNGPPVQQVLPRQDRSGDPTTPSIEFTH